VREGGKIKNPSEGGLIRREEEIKTTGKVPITICKKFFFVAV